MPYTERLQAPAWFRCSKVIVTTMAPKNQVNVPILRRSQAC